MLPWLILPEDYPGTLAEVFKKWRDAGIRQAQAQSDFDDVAKRSKALKEMSTPQAMRKNARDALRGKYPTESASTGSDPVGTSGFGEVGTTPGFGKQKAEAKS